MRLSTTTKVTSVLTLAIVLIAAIGVVSFRSTNALVDSRAQVERTYEVLMRLESVLAKLTDAEGAQRGYVITGDSSYLAPYFTAVDQLGQDLEVLEARMVDASHHARLALLGVQAERRFMLMERIIAVRDRAGPDSAAAMVSAGEGRLMMSDLRATVAELRAREHTLLEGRTTAAEATAIRTKGIAAAGGIFALLVVASTGYFISRDLRRRQMMEQAVRESEALLNQFLECLPAGAYVVDAAGRPRYANALARAIFGNGVRLDAGGGEGLPHSHVVHHAPSGTPYRMSQLPIARALRGQVVRADDVEIRRDGDAIPLRVSAAPIFAGDGTVSFAIAVLSDISDEKRTEERLRRAKEAAEHANRTKSEFLARMSHELRTPLNSVIGFSNILGKNRGGTLSARDLEFLDRIGANGRHLLALINDILDLSKIESGKVEVELAAVDLRALVEETVWQQREVNRGRPLEISAELPATLGTVEADAGRLRQVLLNLVGNAVKFTESGAVRVVVDAADDGTPIRIRVIDTGIGVPADRQGAIFEAFEQADSGTARSYGGTGLGLPISRALCELMRFRLSMTSQEGVGSEFVIELRAADRACAPSAPVPPRVPHPPRAVAPPAAAVAGAARPEEDAVGAREPAIRTPARRSPPNPLVLVVDDEADSRVLLAHQLEEAGCRVLSTPCGDAAIELARRARPDLITLDLLMPEPTGWDVLARLKADPELRDIPSVIVSVIAEEHRGNLPGAVDVLAKPLRREDLAAVLRRNVPAGGRVRLLLMSADEALRARAVELSQGRCHVIAHADAQAAIDAITLDIPDVIMLDGALHAGECGTLLQHVRGQPELAGIPMIILTDGGRADTDFAGLIGRGGLIDARTELRAIIDCLVNAAAARRAARADACVVAAGAA